VFVQKLSWGADLYIFAYVYIMVRVLTFEFFCQRNEQLEQALEAAKKAAAQRDEAAKQETSRTIAMLQEEVRFWKVEALRVASVSILESPLYGDSIYSKCTRACRLRLCLSASLSLSLPLSPSLSLPLSLSLSLSRSVCQGT
jgi:hypothetical protein